MYNHVAVMCIKDLLKQLKPWLVKRGYKEDYVDSENEKVKLVKRTVSFQKRNKNVDDSIAVVLTYHPELNQSYKILRRTYKHVLKSPRLPSAGSVKWSYLGHTFKFQG